MAVIEVHCVSLSITFLCTLLLLKTMVYDLS